MAHLDISTDGKAYVFSNVPTCKPTSPNSDLHATWPANPKLLTTDPARNQSVLLIPLRENISPTFPIQGRRTEGLWPAERRRLESAAIGQDDRINLFPSMTRDSLYLTMIFGRTSAEFRRCPIPGDAANRCSRTLRIFLLTWGPRASAFPGARR